MPLFPALVVRAVGEDLRLVLPVRLVRLGGGADALPDLIAGVVGRVGAVHGRGLVAFEEVRAEAIAAWFSLRLVGDVPGIALCHLSTSSSGSACCRGRHRRS